MTPLSVLISGAGIAGTSLAHWLAGLGCRVTVVEKASGPRPGGQAVDFKGATHRMVLDRMGVLPQVLAEQTGRHDQTVIDAIGRRRAVIPGSFTGGDIEIGRGDLAGILYRLTADRCRYVFGDGVAALDDDGAAVTVTFESGDIDAFDIVVGADGIHSRVRALTFGPEPRFVKHLGHYYALADIEVPGDAVMYNEPGRMVAVGGPKASAFFVFAAPELRYDRFDTASMVAQIRNAYAGAGWRVPDLLGRLDTGEVYLDSISRVQVAGYARGRVVLLGDAGYGNTLGGFGTGLAVVGAYVLAGELQAADGDHRRAFAGYERVFRPYAKVSKAVNAGPFLAPPSRPRIWLRNLTFRAPVLLAAMMKLTDRFATRIDLPDYAMV